MKDSSDFFLIIVENVDDTQRNLIQAAVRQQAKKWWHQYVDLWMVQGGTSAEWVRELKVFVTIGPSQLLVFKMPHEGNREWSAYGSSKKWQWLTEEYATSSGQPPESVLQRILRGNREDEDESRMPFSH